MTGKGRKLPRKPMWVAGFMSPFRRRPAMDLVGDGGAGFLGWWVSRSMEVHRPVWPEMENPSRSSFSPSPLPIGPDSERFRQRFAVMPVGIGRGGGDASNETGHEAGGGRTAAISAGEGRPRGRESRGKRENRGRGERKMVSKNGNPKI